MGRRTGRREFLSASLGGVAALTAGCLGGGSGSGGTTGVAPGGDATMRTTVELVSPRMQEEIKNFDTLRVRFETLDLRSVEGETITFDPVDRTKDLTNLGGGEWTVVDDMGMPSGTYERATFHLTVEEAVHSSDGDVEYDSGSPIEKPLRDLGNEPIEFPADETTALTLSLNPSKNGGNWHFITGYSVSNSF